MIRNKKIVKIAIMMSIVVFMSSFIPENKVIASSIENEIEYEHLLNQVNQYANEMEKLYIETSISYDNVAFSDIYEIENEQSDLRNFAAFALNGSDCIGMLLINYDDDDFSSSYISQRISYFHTAIESGTLSIESNDKSLFFCVGDKRIAFMGEAFNRDVQCINDLMMNHNAYFSPVSGKMNLSSVSGARREYVKQFGSHYGMLYVPIVSNTSVGTRGLCWCASISSIGAFCTSEEPLEALELYSLISSKYPLAYGTPYYETKTFFIYGLTPTCIYSGLTYESVAEKINDSKPIYISLSDENGNNDHAVVLCGYQSAQGGYYFYKLMDPNVNGYVTVTVSSLKAKSFVYNTPYSLKYTIWNYSMF